MVRVCMHAVCMTVSPIGEEPGCTVCARAVRSRCVDAVHAVTVKSLKDQTVSGGGFPFGERG